MASAIGAGAVCVIGHSLQPWAAGAVASVHLVTDPLLCSRGPESLPGIRRSRSISGGSRPRDIGEVMTDVIKTHSGALPTARSIRWNPSPAELRELTSRMPNARHTEYDNLQRADQGGLEEQGEHVRGHRSARGALGPDHQPRRRREDRRAPGCVHPRPGHAGHRRLHRQRSRAPRRGSPVHRGGQRQHRRHAALAVLRRREPGPRLRARADGHLHAQPRRPGISQRPDHRRRPRRRRDPRAQQRLLRRVEEGRPAHVEQAHLRPGGPVAARRLQGGADGQG